MKVLEVTTSVNIKDPHRRYTDTLTDRSRYVAADGYGLELHPSGLAVFIRGKDRTVLAPIAHAVVVEDVEQQAAEPAAQKRGKRG